MCETSHLKDAFIYILDVINYLLLPPESFIYNTKCSVRLKLLRLVV